MVASSFTALLSKRRGFLASVYAILIAQVVLTSAVVAYLRSKPAVAAPVRKYALLWAVLAIGVVLLMGLVPMPPAAKLALLGVLSALMGALSMATSDAVPLQSIQVALASTVAVFVFMSVAGVALAAAGIDLGFMAFALMVALFALIAALVLTALLAPHSKAAHTALLSIAVALFSVLLVFDTNVMLQKGYGGDAIQAAVGLYLDVLNIFTADLGLQ